MLNHLQQANPDPILQLIELYNNDPREDKIDLGVGVFKDESGKTPVMKAIKQAEEQLLNTQESKAYVGMAGNQAFNQAMAHLIFGQDTNLSRVRGIQATGGSGALKILAEMLYTASNKKRIWVSNPTWGNHFPIFQRVGFEIEHYPYLDLVTREVNEDALLEQFQKFNSDDIVLLHGVCHNPSGAELSQTMWQEIARLANQNGFLPFVDLAYQGFGNSLEEDCYGVRTLFQNVPEMVVASSCSKNFGLYKERIGASFIVSNEKKVADVARDHTYVAARTAYSMPPDHGASCVELILNNKDMRQLWEQELDTNRNRILSIREKLAATLRERSGHHHWDFIARHRGMFSLLVINEHQRQRLIDEYAIYCVTGGRINIAGLKDSTQISRFVDAIINVTSES